MLTTKARRDKVCELLQASGIDVAVIGDPLSIFYLTGHHVIPYERFYGLVVHVRERRLDMINPSVDTGCMGGDVPEHTYLDEVGPQAVITALTANCGVLAVDQNYFSMAEGRYFAAVPGVTLTGLGDCLTRARMYKDAQEAETMRQAVAIVDETLDMLKTAIRPGMSETEIKMMMLAHMSQYEGFSIDEIIILALGGENSANPHGASGSYVLREGDVLLLDFCAYYRHYWSDITRCLFLGSVGQEKLREIYDVVLGANLAAIAKVRPGVKAREIDQAARDYITQRGYGEYFLHRTGHGLGLSVHEEPNMTSDSELVLEPGMTFTIEPGIYLAGIGGIRLEDNILVTEDGCEILTRSSKKLEDNIIPLS